MVRTKAKSMRQPSGGDISEFVALIATIPIATFTRMAMKSGLPPRQSRELISLFRSIQG